MTRWFTRLGEDRGEANLIGLMVLSPVLLGIVLLMGVAHRQSQTALVTLDVARSAARAASTAESAGEAAALATRTATANIDPKYRGTCNSTVDTSGWQAGSIAVTVQCTTDTSGLIGFGVSIAGNTVERTWVEPVDAARLVRTGP